MVSFAGWVGRFVFVYFWCFREVFFGAMNELGFFVSGFWGCFSEFRLRVFFVFFSVF